MAEKLIAPIDIDGTGIDDIADIVRIWFDLVSLPSDDMSDVAIYRHAKWFVTQLSTIIVVVANSSQGKFVTSHVKNRLIVNTYDVVEGIPD